MRGPKQFILPEGQIPLKSTPSKSSEGIRQLDEKRGFDAIREVARCRVAVATVETGNEYAFVDRRNESVHILRAERHGQNRGRADGGLCTQLIGIVRIDVVHLQDSLIEDFPLLRGDAFAVEVTCAGRSQ